ncbi:hypothetical protein CGZ91_07425 [Parenemella sanctibonifatiensis]|uniref:DUF3515 domain-containing protein n=2 Tax=Parenemella sanctibonifatiensis TaxID=2016505 RepID=A0A255EIB3_9ACTN|nr:hypothetical protein CGZ91_07425 [Parenemella sanctibonifatiensis]
MIGRPRLAVVAAGVMLLATGCTVTAPAPDPGSVQTCADLIAAAPAVVAGQPQRATDQPESAVAWGDPAVLLACGVADPPGFGPTSECYEVDGIGWYAEPVDGAYRFTTLDRTPRIQVTVPSAYEPQAAVLTDLSEAISTTIPQQRPCV